MLVLTRRISESLVMGDGEVIITVLGVKGNQVRIGIQAPENTQVDREELYLRKQQDKKMKASRDNTVADQNDSSKAITEKSKAREDMSDG